MESGWAAPGRERLSYLFFDGGDGGGGDGGDGGDDSGGGGGGGDGGGGDGGGVWVVNYNEFFKKCNKRI